MKTSDFYSKSLKSSVPETLKYEAYFVIEIELIDIQKPDQQELEKSAFLEWIRGMKPYEQELLNQYLKNEKLDIEPLSSGLYHIVLKKGNGKTIEIGDTIIFHYLGRFLDGTIFDNSRSRNEPFGFVMGQQWQVVQGLEEGLKLMQEFERAMFIMPSTLAFGDEGSTTGIVPPGTSVIFEVEMLEVRKARQVNSDSNQ